MRQTQNASKKDNRKSILVIGLLLLLVAVIGFGGYTLSKYVTKKSVKDNKAQVAKWGFTIDAKATDLFGKNYKAGVVTTDTSDKAALSASAAGDYNIVAPGHSGSMTFSIAGTAEVKAEVSFNLDVVHDVSLVYKIGEGENTTYSPVKWTLKKGTTVVVDGKTLADVKSELEKNQKQTYNANDTAINETYTLSWEWKYYVDDNTDLLDTYLAAEAGKAELPTNYTKVSVDKNIEFSLTISIAQVNPAA